ncbi:hypothetical protein E2C01_026858 [Portunus trituberculatus]|uniref:Uncharacterized protein n=1 Tax=Portunus trituberculatus TaxID=210409 RepID=A0A5B7EJY4_PORTR|nr:hypothetical protein [Portunus trituberculatus]
MSSPYWSASSPWVAGEIDVHTSASSFPSVSSWGFHFPPPLPPPAPPPPLPSFFARTPFHQFCRGFKNSGKK